MAPRKLLQLQTSSQLQRTRILTLQTPTLHLLKTQLMRLLLLWARPQVLIFIISDQQDTCKLLRLGLLILTGIGHGVTAYCALVVANLLAALCLMTVSRFPLVLQSRD
nr:MAG TPA: hypothetical protein [Caudoviricetes sp.]